jgi:tetratricopeptide (TPR) repeat protein
VSNILDKFRRRGDSDDSMPPQNSALREALEAGQRAKYAEDYPQALEAFHHALQLASNAGDTTAIAVITLHLSDVYAQMKRWPEADELLNYRYQTAREVGQRTQMAYLMNGIGMLAQSRGDWTKARESYEQALELARAGRAVGAEGRALGNLAATYLHESNASYASHLLRDALPKLNLSGDVELSSYFVGLLGQAFIASGQEIEGQQMLERALKLAEQMGYRRYQRRWHLVLGERAGAEGRDAEAYEHFKTAVSLFNEETPEYVAALCSLSRAALNLRNMDEALEAAKKAVAMSEAFEDKSIAMEARGTLGMALLANKHGADAIPHLQAAADSFAGQPATTAEIDILRHLAAAQIDAGKPGDAIETYKRAAARAEATQARLELAQTRRDLGLAYAKARRYAEAIQEWMAALTIYDTLKHPAQVARLYCDIAGARKFLGQGQRAMKDYEQALMTLNSLNGDQETRGLVVSNAANAYVDQGDIETAESFFNEAINLARKTGNETAEATRRGNYGWFLLAIGRPQQALAALEYALRMSRMLGLSLQAAIQTDNMGLAQDTMGSYDRALELHQDAVSQTVPLNELHWEYVFKCNQGNTLLALGRLDEAGAFFRAALEQGRKDEDAELIIRAQTGLGQLALRQGQPGAAASTLEEAINLARRADMRRLLAEAMSAGSEQQAMLGHVERSASLWDEAHKLFTMLHAPQAKTRPAWLDDAVKLK